jgi:hypothetical protein
VLRASATGDTCRLDGHGIPEASAADLLRIELLGAVGSRDLLVVHEDPRSVVEA